MTDDPLPPHSVSSPSFEGSIDTGVHLIPPPDEMDKKTDGQMRDLITDLINSVAAATLDGAENVSVIARAILHAGVVAAEPGSADLGDQPEPETADSVDHRHDRCHHDHDPRDHGGGRLASG
jgi:hypothetical protein